MEFLKNHIYLIKDTPSEFSYLDITGKEYRIMAVPDDCIQLCHVDKEDVKMALQRRDCAVCHAKMCEKSSENINRKE